MLLATTRIHLIWGIIWNKIKIEIPAKTITSTKLLIKDTKQVDWMKIITNRNSIIQLVKCRIQIWRNNYNKKINLWRWSQNMSLDLLLSVVKAVGQVVINSLEIRLRTLGVIVDHPEGLKKLDLIINSLSALQCKIRPENFILTIKSLKLERNMMLRGRKLKWKIKHLL